MPWWTWVALGLFLFVGATVVIGSAVLALRTYRGLRASQRRLTEAMERLASELDTLGRRADRISERATEAERRVAAARRSAEKLAVLRWALGDSLNAVTRLRQAVPRK